MGNKPTDASKLLGAYFDLFHKLEFDAEEFLERPTKYKALDFASSAWHLLDWTYAKDKARPHPRYTSLSDVRRQFQAKCPELAIMHDLLTGIKHFTVSEPRSESLENLKAEGGYVEEGYVQEGYCSSGELVLNFSDGASIPFDVVLKKVLDFWTYHVQHDEPPDSLDQK